MRHSVTLILLLALTACSSLSDKDALSGKTAEELYAMAMVQMDNVSYDKAIKLFETLQSRYPYGRYAQQAQLEMAYAYYKHDEPDSALSEVDRFIKQYPNNSHVDYAYYLKGLINFNEELGLLGNLTQPDLSERDPREARAAFDAFRDLVTRFPNSKYAADSRLRMQYLTNSLARHETQVAGYYLRRGAYTAAASRANGVLTEFPHTAATRDALQIMVQAYDAMGITELRDDAQRVLDLNIARDGIRPSTKESPINQRKWWQFWM